MFILICNVAAILLIFCVLLKAKKKHFLRTISIIYKLYRVQTGSNKIVAKKMKTACFNIFHLIFNFVAVTKVDSSDIRW